MTISSARVYRYALPLTEPLPVGGTRLTEREGAVLCLRDADGRAGWGEAAPLPGFSTESLDQVLHALGRIAEQIEGTTLPEGAPTEVWETVSEEGRPTSVQFALDSALLALWVEGHNELVHRALGADRSHLDLNGLIPDDVTEVGAAAQRLRAAGYRAVKLKVARRSVGEDIERVRALHESVGRDVTIRLDANRGWSLGEAVTFAEGIADVPIAFVEEPLQQRDQLSDFAAQTDLSVALDETTREASPTLLQTLDFVEAVVLKPTLLGGLQLLKRWVRAASQHQMTPVISASYESGLGLRMLAALAAAWTVAPSGLSTYDRLADDLLSSPLPLNGPTVDLDALHTATVDTAVLTAV